MATSLEIFPSIGVARVGNSPSHFVFDGPASAALPRRDAAGALLRQGVEFRIYKCERDAAGLLLGAIEVTEADASIEWTVHLANRKATGNHMQGGGRRNNAIGNDTQDAPLIIDSGPQNVLVANQAQVLQGAFTGVPVKLGEISKTAQGRLLVLGGDGSAGSPGNLPIGDFADNDGWFDTASDGVVRATVTPPGGNPSAALEAWVVVAPPDYAPPIANLVTMYDVLVDLAISRGVFAQKLPIVFSRDVQPILERAMGYQWVTRAAREGYSTLPSGGHSPVGPGDFTTKMARLADPAQAKQPRIKIFRLLRDPSAAPQAQNLIGMPRLNDDKDSGDVFPLTHAQYRAMQLWSDGQFVTTEPAPVELEPERLTREALEACSGGPFFPGIEAGRIMRDTSRYLTGQAFRLSPTKLKPGEVTQNNAVPWQADFQLCRWEETNGGSQKLLAWWPAQRPDDVLTGPGTAPVAWTRGIPDSFEGMLANWQRLGLVMEDAANPGTFVERDRDPTLP